MNNSNKNTYNANKRYEFHRLGQRETEARCGTHLVPEKLLAFPVVTQKPHPKSPTFFVVSFATITP